MREVLSLVKINVISMIVGTLGDENPKKRIRNILLIFIFFLIILVYGVIKGFNVLSVFGGEILIFNLILNTQIILIILLAFSRVVNGFYLASDWKEMMVYPVDSGSILVSKCILSYITSSIVTVVMIIPLFIYGVLIDANIFYYLGVLGFQIIISFIPTGYITLVSLIMFWVVSGIKGTKYTHKNNKWFIVISLMVVGLTYLLVRNIPNTNIESLLINTFFNGDPSILLSAERVEILIKLIISLIIIIIFSLWIYFLSGNVYVKIMKSGIFSSNSSYKTKFSIVEDDFRARNPIISNVIRDIKLIMRTSYLRIFCFSLHTLLSIYIFIMILFAKDTITEFASNYEGIKSYFVIWLFIMGSVLNFTSITSFSREGRAIRQFNVYPISKKDFLISKLIVIFLSNTFLFIGINMFMAMFTSTLIEFILLELALVIFIIGTAIILISKDLKDINSKWVDSKDLIYTRAFKVYGPFFYLLL